MKKLGGYLKTLIQTDNLNLVIVTFLLLVILGILIATLAKLLVVGLILIALAFLYIVLWMAYCTDEIGNGN